ncbi:hypothetical protein, partial [Methylobacterium oryzisoli]|uniref:hypothetical protein n=1 Tax=Methylobacterium oryzisoli TaxID=3385502 RepID=UPI003978D6DE
LISKTRQQTVHWPHVRPGTRLSSIEKSVIQTIFLGVTTMAAVLVHVRKSGATASRSFEERQSQSIGLEGW